MKKKINTKTTKLNWKKNHNNNNISEKKPKQQRKQTK